MTILSFIFICRMTSAIDFANKRRKIQYVPEVLRDICVIVSCGDTHSMKYARKLLMLN